MAKRVFFSFHYEDVKSFRVNVVRNHNKLTSEDAGFFDASIWEDAKKHGDNAVRKLIDDNLYNTSVTCVLIGNDTWKRKWVRYEVFKSYLKGNFLLGIHINYIKDKYQNILYPGPNIFDYIGIYINSEGNELKFIEFNGVEWITYSQIPTIKISNWHQSYWGRCFSFAQLNVKVFDWVLNDGYNNFSKWINNN